MLFIFGILGDSYSEAIKPLARSIGRVRWADLLSRQLEFTLFQARGIANESERVMRRKLIRSFAVTLAIVPACLAQVGTSPWENAVNVLRNSFTGPIATGLSLVAIVVG